ncbi:hypothetical protein EG344_19955 [Chryseobacterium sp. G0162]|uniref:hypothetical protein n=1 Tax=Chryseobacterium sp. G0162 TaxID=2487063 RepID=UPI000F4E53EB|nr:hypothetical protein [Chryseobacterium sp. G0162]AZB10945.1 hypothetical protein EG344_19955 [Chryseobacterium sp. G0162]
MKITIPTPCHENWNNMIPDEKGKFCSVCFKTVQDFTRFSDEELINSFDSNENICGRFREDQLGINLNFSLASKLAFGLWIVGGFTTVVNAQEIKPTEKVQEVNMSVIPTGNFNRNPSLRMGAPISRPADKPLVLLNNKKISIEELQTLKPETIESINSFLPAEAIKRYGQKAKHGAIVLTTKK